MITERRPCTTISQETPATVGMARNTTNEIRLYDLTGPLILPGQFFDALGSSGCFPDLTYSLSHIYFRFDEMKDFENGGECKRGYQLPYQFLEDITRDTALTSGVHFLSFQFSDVDGNHSQRGENQFDSTVTSPFEDAVDELTNRASEPLIPDSGFGAIGWIGIGIGPFAAIIAIVGGI